MMIKISYEACVFKVVGFSQGATGIFIYDK